MTEKKWKFWGWGYEEQSLSESDSVAISRQISKLTGIPPSEYIPPPRLNEITLDAPTLRIPESLTQICSTSDYDRASHTYGKSYPDYIRAFKRDFSCAPDVVAFPKTETDIIALLDWADSSRIAVIPFGGGSSVVGGVEPDVGKYFQSTLTLDMKRMNRVLETDITSRAALIQAGTLGPSLEQQLKPSGLTLRHFPQSFEFSTLGGWIATRSGGHFATLYTHIDELVESLEVVCPSGKFETRRLPGSGAGPSPDRMIIGSEGALGIITKAWMRLQKKPLHRASCAVQFKNFESAVEAIRAIAQAGLWPSNCRLIDSEECKLTGAGDGSFNLCVLGFESSNHPLDAWMSRALQCATDNGGEVGEVGKRNATADLWRDAFIRAPFKREGLISCGILHDTFETAITWDKLINFYTNVKNATEEIIIRTTGAPGHVSCRFTHAYTDGVAPYFTIHAKANAGREIDEWKIIKKEISNLLIDEGGTITHHHAIGRDHMPWYKQQRPTLIGEAFKSVKETLDPKGLLNPGVIIPSR